MRQFNTYQEVELYLRASVLVYMENDAIVKNVRTLLPSDSEYKDAKYFKYRERTNSVLWGFGSSIDAIEKIIRKVFDHVNCIVIESKSRKETIIAFRGTNITDFKDLGNDLNIAKDAFFPLSEAIKKYVQAIVTGSSEKGHKIIFTGHSLGGYIASKMTLEFKHTSVVFDSPGVEGILQHHKGANIHCFVSSPNFVNCLGNHIGNLYHIPPMKNATNYAEFYNEMINIAVKATASSQVFADLKHFLMINVIKPVSIAGFSSVSGMSKQDVQYYVDKAVGGYNALKEPAAEIKKAFDEKEKQYGLMKKLEHTLKTHQLDMMLNNLNDNREEKIKQIDANHWPTAQTFCECDLSSLKIVFHKEKLVVPSSLGPIIDLLRNIHEAEKTFNQFVENIEQNPTLRDLIGLLQEDKSSASLLERQFIANPFEYDYHVFKGIVQAIAGNNQQALDSYEKAIQLTSTRPEAVYFKEGYLKKSIDEGTARKKLMELRAKIHLSDSDRRQAEMAWNQLLKNLNALLSKSKHAIPQIFISYAWEEDPIVNEGLQRWLKRLQNDLEKAAGVSSVFLDIRDMGGHMKNTMQQGIQASRFILLIITPRYLERAKNPDSNASFEYTLSLAKGREQQSVTLIPIIYSGDFDLITGPLKPLSDYLVLKRHIGYEKLLLGPSDRGGIDPSGLIPRLFNIGDIRADAEYQSCINTWQDSILNRLPQIDQNYIFRTRPLEQLTKNFKQAVIERRNPVQVIHGLPGLGKTKLALMFAQQNHEHYDFIRWVDADNLTLESEWRRFAEQLGIDPKGQSQHELQQTIHDQLAKRSRWLIIFDNAGNEQNLAGFLPKQQTATQHILITSRSSQWSAQVVYPMEVFTTEEALSFIQRICPTASTDNKCMQLAETLGHLPLALSQALSYIKDTGDSVSQYLEKYKTRGMELLETKASIAGDYPHTVLTTWHLSMDRLKLRSPIAAEALNFCAYLFPTEIPADVLQTVLAQSDTDFEKTQIILRDFSLLSYSTTGFAMHRLVQTAIRYRDTHSLSKEEILNQRLTPLARALNSMLPRYPKKGNHDAKARSLLPHLEVMVELLRLNGGPKSVAKRETLTTLGLTYYLMSGSENVSKAIQCYQDALLILEEKTDKNTTDEKLRLWNSMGASYLSLAGKQELSQALRYYLKALVLFERQSDQHYSIDLAISLNGLGAVYRALDGKDNLVKSVEYHQKALSVCEKHWDKDHLEVAISLNSLGNAYWSLGDAKSLHKAIACHQRAINIRKSQLGEDHLLVAESFINLGAAYQSLGEQANILESIRYYEIALTIREKQLTTNHPDLADPLNNLGSAYWSLGGKRNLQRTIDYFKRALDIRQQQLGKDHPMTALSLQNLGAAYHDMGGKENIDRAIQCSQESLKIRETRFGKDHPSVASSLSNLGSAYCLLGGEPNLRESIRCHARALKIRTEKLEKTHLDIAYSLQNLGDAYQALGKAENVHRAIEYHKKGLAIRQKTLVADHPFIAGSWNSLGSAYCSLDGGLNLRRAIIYHMKALLIRQRQWGNSHLDTAQSLHNLGVAYQRLGGLDNLKEAIQHYKGALAIRQQQLDENHPVVLQTVKQLEECEKKLMDKASVKQDNATSTIELSESRNIIFSSSTKLPQEKDSKIHHKQMIASRL